MFKYDETVLNTNGRIRHLHTRKDKQDRVSEEHWDGEISITKTDKQVRGNNLGLYKNIHGVRAFKEDGRIRLQKV